MARKPRSDTPNGSASDKPPEPNVAARKDTIRDVCKKLQALESQRKDISEEIASLKQTKIKGDLGMKIGDFNTAYRLYQLEGDDRDQLLDTLRETFEALGVGAQLDFLGAMKEGGEGDEERGTFPGGHGDGEQPSMQ